jgi:hypothetical protein
MTEPLTEEAILERVQAGQLGLAEAKELLQKLKAAGEPRSQLRCQVAKSGGISVYGLGRFPVTLYVEQWERVLGFADEIRRFAADHAAELKKKGGK